MDINFTEDGKLAWDALCQRFLLITRESQIEQARRHIAWIMMEKNLSRADKEVVIEAAKCVIRPRALASLREVLEPTEIKRLKSIYKTDKDAYYAMPRFIKRWPSVPLESGKPASEMKVLAINASPRITGNTNALIDEALRGVRDAGASVEKLNLQKLDIKHCIGCRRCKEPDFKGFCAINDDMQQIYPKVLNADAIVIGFPIYTNRQCAQLATFQDRWGALYRHNALQTDYRRRAMVICTWGSVHAEVEDYTNIISQIISWLRICRYDVTEAISACGFAGMLHGFDDDHRAIILRYPEELAKVYQAGRSLVLGG